MIKLFKFPLPAMAVLFPPQFDPLVANGLPAWIVAFFTGAFVVLSTLEKFGKLPGGGGSTERRHGTGQFDQRAASELHEVHRLLSYRHGDDSERFLKHVQMTGEIHELVKKLAIGNDTVVRLLQDQHKTAGMSAATLQALQSSLNGTAAVLRDISDKQDALAAAIASRREA